MVQDPSLLTSANPAQGEQISSGNDEYDDLLQTAPGIEPVAGTEEPNQAEQAHYDNLYADFMEELYDNQSDAVVKVLKAPQELYSGAANAAFMILKKVYTAHDNKNGPTPPAALFGEGGMIHTAVDEMFKFAQAYRLDGANVQDQYTAAQMDMMRQVGEFLEKDSDDESVREAQELMIDIDEAGGGGAAGPVAREDRDSLEAIQFQDEAEMNTAAANAGASTLQPAGGGEPGEPTQAPIQPPAQPPQQGGLV